MTTTCPYCNAAVPPPTAVPDSGRLRCPRCGESFPAPPGANHASVTTSGTASDSTPSSASRRGRNLRLGGAVLALMLLLAAVVAVALVNTRGKRGLTTLAEMEALGYLPDDTNVIVAVKIPDAEKSKEGREMLDRLGLGAGGTLDLEKISGLKRDQIDEAVLGLRVDTNLIPRVRLVVRTHSAFDVEAVKAKLGAKASKKDGNRTYDVIQPPKLLLEGALWLPSPRTLVAVFPPTDLEKVPTEPTDKVERFGAPLANLLRYRPERDTFFWLVGHSDDWRRTALPLILPRFSEPDRELIFQVRTFGLGLRMDTGATPSRSRPARISADTPPEAPRIAADLVIETAPDTDMPALVDALDGWVDRQKLVPASQNRSDNRYSITVTGTPEEWERALGSLRNPVKR